MADVAHAHRLLEAQRGDGDLLGGHGGHKALATVAAVVAPVGECELGAREEAARRLAVRHPLVRLGLAGVVEDALVHGGPRGQGHVGLPLSLGSALLLLPRVRFLDGGDRGHVRGGELARGRSRGRLGQAVGAATSRRELVAASPPTAALLRRRPLCDPPGVVNVVLPPTARIHTSFPPRRQAVGASRALRGSPRARACG
mmetsp:Transcript_18362/g.49390  ORF Transcript_18362/g.49390 Transcript_18362/m.49390 type:complete len:200 (-) Transcript_18362:128-727(-)